MMQPDGNLVIYGPGGPVWASSWFQQFNVAPFEGPTYGIPCGSCYAYFQEDGNLVLYNPEFSGNPYRAYWSSNTYGNNRVYTLTTSSPYLKISEGIPPQAVDFTQVLASYYQKYLGRGVDSAGLATFSAQYQNGKSLAAIEQEIQNSYEAQLRLLYLTYFLREPDHDGFQYWYNELVSGRSTLDQIRRNFRSVTECKFECL